VDAACVCCEHDLTHLPHAVDEIFGSLAAEA